MDIEYFKTAIDSMRWYPKMTGIQGGEPLLHPDFEKICQYAKAKIGRRRLGLWTTFPEGYEKYRELIVQTFGSVFLNDHSRPDVYHHPFMVASKEVLQDTDEMYMAINRCWFQESWSASINPNGAYFCEIAASMSMLFKDSLNGWPVEPGWWKRQVWDFKEQIEHFCPNCGGGLKLLRRPSSCKDGIDDISPGNLERLNGKIKNYHVHDLKQVQDCDLQPLASYKDVDYRARIASRYGIFLTLNPLGFNEPHLMAKAPGQAPLLEQFREKYGG
jgi:hypothetical protein